MDEQTKTTYSLEGILGNCAVEGLVMDGGTLDELIREILPAPRGISDETEEYGRVRITIELWSNTTATDDDQAAKDLVFDMYGGIEG